MMLYMDHILLAISIFATSFAASNEKFDVLLNLMKINPLRHSKVFNKFSDSLLPMRMDDTPSMSDDMNVNWNESPRYPTEHGVTDIKIMEGMFKRANKAIRISIREPEYTVAGSKAESFFNDMRKLQTQMHVESESRKVTKPKSNLPETYMPQIHDRKADFSTDDIFNQISMPETFESRKDEKAHEDNVFRQMESLPETVTSGNKAKGEENTDNLFNQFDSMPETVEVQNQTKKTQDNTENLQSLTTKKKEIVTTTTTTTTTEEAVIGEYTPQTSSFSELTIMTMSRDRDAPREKNQDRDTSIEKKDIVTTTTTTTSTTTTEEAVIGEYTSPPNSYNELTNDDADAEVIVF